MEWLDKAYDQLSRDELFESLKLRAAVFNDEQKSYWPDPDDNDRRARHVMAFAGDQLVAYARYFAVGDKVTLGRVVVSPDFRGQGLGKDLLHHVMAGIKNHYGQRTIVIHAQLYVQQLYEQFGFAAHGETFIEAQREHVLMTHAPLADDN